MILYEVNLQVDREIEDDYLAWLRPHIEEMLTFAGFIDAHLWTRAAEDEGEVPDQTARFTIHYQVTDREHLDAYFQGPAQRMRDDGLLRFEGQFTASRRILQRT